MSSDAPRPVQFIGAPGLTLRGTAWGPSDGMPVLLLHGGGQTHRAWRATGQALAEQGWFACAVDLRGHGGSDWAPDGDYSLDTFVGDVRAMCASFDRLPAVVGASLGGSCALVAIGEAPSPIADALVLVDIAARTSPEGTKRILDFMSARMHDGFASLDEMATDVARFNPRRVRQLDPDGLRANAREQDGRWYWHWDPAFLLGHAVDPRDALAPIDRLEAAARDLAVPTLLIRGGASDVVAVEAVDRFLALNPKEISAAEVADAGHMVVGDENDAFNNVITSFLRARRQLA